MQQLPSRWKRDGVDLQALEDKLRIEIDPAFFEAEQDFRPFNQVIEILSVSLDQDKDIDESPDFDQLAENPLHKNIQRQLQVCSDVVERITVEHHGSLNSSVQAMGGVARHYNQTRANVGTLREQLRECKQLLQTGSSQTDVRELWQRKLQYSLVLRLLNALDMIKDAPVKFERLVRQKRFVGAVDLLNESLVNIFSAELVDVPAVAGVRDEMLAQKGRILDTLVEEIANVLFLRASTAQVGADRARGSAKSRRRERRGAGGAGADESPGTWLSRGQATAAGGGMGVVVPSDAASDSSAGGDGTGTWAGLQVDVTDVGDNEEQALDDPSQELGVYLRLLVEAVRRLRCLDDVERYLLERLPNEVLNLSATHMRTCMGKREEVGINVRGASSSSTTQNDGPGAGVQNLTQYLSLVFDSFTSVLGNLIRLVRLLHAARLRDLREHDLGAPVFEADASYKESLVVRWWQQVQAHLVDVLARHVSSSQGGDAGEDASKVDAGGLPSNRIVSGPSGAEASNVSSLVPYFRPLRRPESSSTGLASAAVELNQVNAADFCRSRVLADPSPMMMMNIFCPTLKFVEVEEAMIDAMKKEIFESGHIHHERGARRVMPEGGVREGANLSAFMHATARDKFLPLLSSNCRAMNAQLVEDHDWCFPVSMASGQGVANLSSADGNMTSRERATGGVGALRPSRGTEDVHSQARILFRAMVQMPHYAEEIGEILWTTLEDFFALVQNKFQDITVNSASRLRLERFSDKLREVLRRDAQYITYKSFVYGGQLRWDESEVNDVLSSRGQKSLSSGPPKSSERQEPSQMESSGQQEADDIFESEFMMLQDLWEFDNVPFPVTKQSLLSLRKQQAIACLAYSCDWLSHKILKICAAMKQKSCSTPRDGHVSGLGGKLTPPPRSLNFEGRIPSSASGTKAPAQKLRQIGRKLHQLADDGLLCLRLEVYMLVSFYMQQLPSIDLEVTSGQGSTTAMSLGRVEDQCVVTLNRCIREEQEALSPFEPKGSMALLCPRDLLAFVLAPLPRLVPRLFVRSFSFIKTKAITVGGVGKLNKILNTLQQTVGDVTDEHKSRNQEEGAATMDEVDAGSQSVGGLVGERFTWARDYIALMSMTQADFETFMQKKRTKYSKEEYRVLWSLAGPNRPVVDGSAAQKFDVWWGS